MDFTSIFKEAVKNGADPELVKNLLSEFDIFVFTNTKGGRDVPADIVNSLIAFYEFYYHYFILNHQDGKANMNHLSMTLVLGRILRENRLFDKNAKKLYTLPGDVAVTLAAIAEYIAMNFEYYVLAFIDEDKRYVVSLDQYFGYSEDAKDAIFIGIMYSLFLQGGELMIYDMMNKKVSGLVFVKERMIGSYKEEEIRKKPGITDDYEIVHIDLKGIVDNYKNTPSA